MVVHAAVDNDGHNFGACASSEFQESGALSVLPGDAHCLF